MSDVRNKLMAKLQKNTTSSHTAILNKSEFFTDIDVISTDIPMINVALSGHLDGGLRSGILGISGESKHFKCVDFYTPLEVYIKE